VTMSFSATSRFFLKKSWLGRARGTRGKMDLAGKQRSIITCYSLESKNVDPDGIQRNVLQQLCANVPLIASCPTRVRVIFEAGL